MRGEEPSCTHQMILLFDEYDDCDVVLCCVVLCCVVLCCVVSFSKKCDCNHDYSWYFEVVGVGFLKMKSRMVCGVLCSSARLVCGSASYICITCTSC